MTMMPELRVCLCELIQRVKNASETLIASENRNLSAIQPGVRKHRRDVQFECVELFKSTLACRAEASSRRPI